MKALVLDADAKCAIVVIRSLGRRGVEVDTATHEKNPYASTSRYVRTTYTCPSPLDERKGFIEWLRGLQREQQYDCIIPLTDYTVFGLLVFREALEEMPVPLPGRSAAEIVFDKAALAERARGFGISAPRYELPERPQDLSGATERLGRPVVVRASRSYDWGDGTPTYVPVSYAHDDEQAKRLAAAVWEAGAKPIVAEYVRGFQLDIETLWIHGRVYSLQAKRVYTFWPVGGGNSVIRETVPIPEDLAQKVTALLKDLEWHGPAQAQFLMDEQRGEPRLIEVNGRFWASLEVNVRSGPDLPYALFAATAGAKLPPQHGSRTGFELRWLLGDIKRLYSLLFDRKRFYDVPNLPSRGQALASFFSPKGPFRFDGFALDDPLPFIAENTIELVRSVARKQKTKQEQERTLET